MAARTRAIARDRPGSTSYSETSVMGPPPSNARYTRGTRKPPPPRIASFMSALTCLVGGGLRLAQTLGDAELAEPDLLQDRRCGRATRADARTDRRRERGALRGVDERLEV